MSVEHLNKVSEKRQTFSRQQSRRMPTTLRLMVSWERPSLLGLLGYLSIDEAYSNAMATSKHARLIWMTMWQKHTLAWDSLR